LRGHEIGNLCFKKQQAEILHALRIEYAIQMIAFMLHNARMKAARLAADRLARAVKAVADQQGGGDAAPAAEAAAEAEPA